MLEKFQKYGLLSTVGIAVVCILIAGLTYNSSGSVTVFINSAYAFFGVAVVLAIVLPVYQAKDNPKALLITGVGIVVIALIFAISWGVASDYTASTLSKNVSSERVRLSGAIINTTWLFLALAVLAVLYTEIKTLIKK